MAGKSPLGFIGLGTMGGVMASRLVEAGHALVVYDTNAAAVQALVDKGAVAAESPAAVASAAEIVFASLPTPDVVRAVATGDKRRDRGRQGPHPGRSLDHRPAGLRRGRRGARRRRTSSSSTRR